MSKESELSLVRELSFFLGLQIKQCEVDIFINQSKYIKVLPKKFNMINIKLAKTSMPTTCKLNKD